MKISELPKALEVSGAEAIPIVQTGETKQASVTQIREGRADGIKLSEENELQLTAKGVPIGEAVTLPPQNGDYIRCHLTKSYIDSKSDSTHPILTTRLANGAFQINIDLAYFENGEWNNNLSLPELPEVSDAGIISYLVYEFSGFDVILPDDVKGVYISLPDFDCQMFNGGYWITPYYGAKKVFTHMSAENNKMTVSIGMDISDMSADEQTVFADSIMQAITGFWICWQKQPYTVEFKTEV